MKAKELLNSPEKWTKKAFARTVYGAECNSFDEKAEKFCLVGAVLRCYSTTEERSTHVTTANQARLKLFPRTAAYSLSEFNDFGTTQFGHIRAILDLADV